MPSLKKGRCARNDASLAMVWNLVKVNEKNILNLLGCGERCGKQKLDDDGGKF